MLGKRHRTRTLESVHAVLGVWGEGASSPHASTIRRFTSSVLVSPPLLFFSASPFFLRLSFSPPSLSFQSPSMVPHPHRFFFLQALVVGRASAALTATRMTQGVRMRLGRSLSYGNLQFEAAHGASCGCTECAPNAHPDGCFCSGCRSEKGHGITCPCSDCNGSDRGYAMHGL